MVRKVVCRGVLIVISAAGAFSPAVRAAESPSALLEKAIYTEETVGDLPAAAKLYEKAVAEAKTVEAVAAKAQYRLGLCLLKQGKKAEGEAALEEVVKRYADQKEIVAKAKKRLPAQPGLKLQPIMWGDGEVLHYRIELAGGLDLGTIIYAVERAELDGKKIWRFHSRTFAATAQLASRVDADFDTLMPINSSWTIAGMGETKCQYERGKVVVTAPGVGKPKTVEVESAPYDNEEAFFVCRCLPLAEKYKTTMPIFASIGSGAINIDFEVQGKETVEVPAGKFNCFRVLLSPVNQSFWLSDDEHRYPVKMVANNVVMPLVKVERPKPGEGEKYSDDVLSLSLPPRWYAYKTKVGVYLLDPSAEWAILLKTTKLSELPKEANVSPRAWIEAGLPGAAKILKDLKVRPDSWESLDLSGSPAMAIAVDYTAADGKPMVQRGIAAFGKTVGLVMNADCPRDDLNRMKKNLEPIVESLEVK